MTAGWTRTKLGSVLSIQNGYAFDSKAFGPSGLPLIRIRDLKSGTSTETHFGGEFDPRYVVNAGDLLIGMDGEFACYEWKGGPALLNQRVCRLQGFSDALNPRFLFYGINKHLKAIEDVTGFTTVKHLSSKQILDIEFFVPPKDEQRRIVAILDEAFDAIATAKANTEKNIQNAREVFESYLAAVFSARNEGWTDRRLASLCQRITVGHVGSMAKLYKPIGIPFLRSQNIRPFSVSMQNLVFIDEQFHASLGKSSLQAGDVAIVRTGYPGTAAVIPHSLGAANCSDLVIARPGPEIDAHFLCAFFNSAFGKAMVSGKVVGAAQKHFNVGAAKDVVLHLPPLAEQEAIVAAADDLRDQTDRLGEVHTRKLAALDELKKSLLHQAFTGQLTAKATDQQLEAVA